MSAQIDLGGQYVDLTIGRKSVRVGLKPDRCLNRSAGETFEDENFSIDSNDGSSEDESESDSEDSMVVAPTVENEILQPQDELVKRKHSRLNG